MAKMELGELRSEIENRKFNWEVADTPISLLSEEQRKVRCGLRVDEGADEAARVAREEALELERASGRRGVLPRSMDWRDHDGVWTTPIRDQKHCGSCVAFAALATLETQVNWKNRTPDNDKTDLSESFLFYCGDKDPNPCQWGWYNDRAMDFLRDTGAVNEYLFPYIDQNQSCPPSLPGGNTIYKITDYDAKLTRRQRREHLAENGPLLAAMKVYEDFYYYGGGVYRHASGQFEGNHAVCIVGYSEDEDCWICKNSWGKSWGDNGWFKIGVGECLIDTRTSYGIVDIDIVPAETFPPSSPVLQH